MRFCDSRIVVISIIFSLTILIHGVPSAEAVREGTANANIMIKRYERAQDFGRAALWRKAAAECLEIISVPMTEILVKYYTRCGNKELAEISQGELTDIRVQQQHHLKLAQQHQAKSTISENEIDIERESIAQFIATWVPHYPDRFYDFGVYHDLFRKQRDQLKRGGDYAAALNIEADAAEICAMQYDEITIAYFRDNAERVENAARTKAVGVYRRKAAEYQEVRDVHLRRATLLRMLARKKPEAWPLEADDWKIETPKSKTRLTRDEVIRIAKSDPRVEQILKSHNAIHEYAWFQGFAWTVSFYNHGWGNLAIAIVNDKAGEVIDVMNQVGNLEAREWREKEARTSTGNLRLDNAEVEQIARNCAGIIAYLGSNPEARLSAAFSKRYTCWLVEVIEGDKEVGFVSVSDKTGKVLEVEINSLD